MATTNDEAKKKVNRIAPGANAVKLGQVLDDLIVAHNLLATKHNALCAKLDLDAGVTDTTYNSLTGVGTTATVGDLTTRG